MRAWSLIVAPLVLVAPAAAQERGVLISVGYAFSQYLEEGGGNAPLGAYFSVASAKKVGFEADVAYHRDSEQFCCGTVVLNTVIAGGGPRFNFGQGSARPFLHALGGVRYDRVEDASNTAFGAITGGGIDIPAGSGMFVRLGADFQIFFDEGANVKTLRLAAGITF